MTGWPAAPASRSRTAWSPTPRCAPPTRTSTPRATSRARSCRCSAPTCGSSTLNGGPAAAKSMLGQEVEYNRVPYFYTDQYELGMECSGLPSPGAYDQVVYRGDRSTLEFIAFWLAGGRLIAGMNVNVWDVTDDIQSLIRSNRTLDPSRLADSAIPLADV